jgi:hypothetical protein
VSLRAVSVANSEEEKMMSVGLDALRERNIRRNTMIGEHMCSYLARRHYVIIVGRETIIVRMYNDEASSLARVVSRHGSLDSLRGISDDNEFRLLLKHGAIKMDYDFLMRKLRYEADDGGVLRLEIGPLAMCISDTLESRPRSAQTPSASQAPSASQESNDRVRPAPRAQSTGRPATAADFGIKEEEQFVTRTSRNSGRVTSAKFRTPKAKN